MASQTMESTGMVQPLSVPYALNNQLPSSPGDLVSASVRVERFFGLVAGLFLIDECSIWRFV